MIEFATRADVPRIMEMAREMHAETRFAAFPFDPERMQKLFEHLIDGAGAIALYRIDGRAVGMAVMGCGEDFFSGTKLAFEYGIYTMPEHRGGLAGPRLVQRFIQWGREQGAALVQAAISTGITTARTGELYEALGMAPVGSLHMMVYGEG